MREKLGGVVPALSSASKTIALAYQAKSAGTVPSRKKPNTSPITAKAMTRKAPH